MTGTLPMPSLEFKALQNALKRALCDRNMTWEKFEVGAQLAKLEVSAQLEGFLEAFMASYPRLRGGLARFEATRAWVSHLILALLLAWHAQNETETSNLESSLPASRAKHFVWSSSLNPALVRLGSCVVWARFLS
jgi:hypothetical protein